MVFSSITFLFYFLPITAALYFLVPGKYQNAVLLLCSLFFYAWGEPQQVPIMGISIVSAYAFGLLIEKYKEKKTGRMLCLLSVCVSLSFLLYFKYANFLLI